MPVEKDQEIEVEEVVDFSEGEFDESELLSAEDTGKKTSSSQSLFSKDSLKDPEKRKKILYIVIGFLVLWTFLEEEEPKGNKNSSKKTNQIKSKKVTKKDTNKKSKKQNVSQKLTKQQKEFIEGQYLLSKELFNQGDYQQTIQELEKLFQVTRKYKRSQQYYNLAKEALRKIEELDRKQKEEEEKLKRLLKVKKLVDKAKKATEDRKQELAESLFNEIISLEPENFDVPQMRLELKAWRDEEDRKKIEKAQKEAERNRQETLLAPGKRNYLEQNWYEAILNLEGFLKNKDLDDDLIKEGLEMLKTSRNKLNVKVDPILGKARSLKEGKDLRGAYDSYSRVLKFNPSHEEALNEVNRIRENLRERSRKVFIQALILESMSLFKDAKEKFQEVQQITPIDSDYYRKATKKLRSYFDTEGE